jgi:plastocyanin
MPDIGLPAVRMTRRLGLVVALAAVALSASPAAAGSAVTVDVRTVSYAPSDLTVARGTTVTWSNTVSPSRVHDVVSSIDGLFDSGRFGRGESWSYRFDAAGTFHYICTIHDTMLGTVHVPLTGRLLDTPSGPIMRIRLAARPLPESSAFRYKVLRRDPGASEWTPWRVTTAAVAEFRPDVPGSYDFVMRIKNMTSDRNTGRAGDSPILRLEWAG